MSWNSLVVAATALLFTVVFGGLCAYYIGGTQAVPEWFIRLRLTESPRNRSTLGRMVGFVIALGFLGLAEWAVVENLDPGSWLASAPFLVAEFAGIAWLIYLGFRFARVSRRNARANGGG